MVYDCIPFFNELDILNLRLHIMDPLVDKFIIEEATVTFSGEPKELCFEKNKELFREFLPKIEYIVVDNSPVDTTTHLRDKFQKNALEKGLVNATDEDVIILSDVDEIPNPKVLKEIIESFDSDKIYHLAQRMFYCYLNMEEVSGNLLSITGEFPGVERRLWLGTKVFSRKSIPSDGIIQLREASTTAPEAVRVADGGWHFGYMGSKQESDVSKRIGTKVVAAAHQEYNNQDTLAEAKDRLILGQDMFGRDARFKRVEIDDSYPKYLLEHLEEYDYLIMPPVSARKLLYTKVSMKIKRFFRKGFRKLRRLLYESEE
ncbi:MAG: glycosyl transferase GT17 family protein [Acetatifactor sp.]